MWLREEGERGPVENLRCWETEMNQLGGCSSPACGYAVCVLVWGLRGGIWPDSSPRREFHNTMSGAVKAAHQVSERVLKQPMKAGFMAYFGETQRFLGTLAGCNKPRRRLFSNPAWILSRGIPHNTLGSPNP